MATWVHRIAAFARALAAALDWLAALAPDAASARANAASADAARGGGAR